MARLNPWKWVASFSSTFGTQWDIHETWIRNLPGDLMNLRVPGRFTPLAMCPFFSFLCLCVFVYFRVSFFCVEVNDKGLLWERATSSAQTLPSHRVSSCLYKKKKRHALYFYEPCNLFCFVVRPLGMHSINFIETRYLETFAYVWAQHNITF